MEKFEKVFSFFEKSLNELLDLPSTFRFDGSHPLHVNAISLYGSIIELSSTLVPLF